MPITQDRMIAVIEAAYEVLRSASASAESRRAELASLISAALSRGVDREALRPLARFCEELIEKPANVPLAALETLAAERAHFLATAKSNARVREYKRRERERRWLAEHPGEDLHDDASRAVSSGKFDTYAASLPQHVPNSDDLDI